MGAWTIVIHGSGAHHNQMPEDADALLVNFVEHLTAKGQTVASAHITTGASERKA